MNINTNINARMAYVGNGFHAGMGRSGMRIGSGSRLRAGATGLGAGSAFGAKCVVTISGEGRKLSAQMNAEKPKSFAAAGTERLLLREQRQAETNRKEQSDTLGEISGLMSEIRRSNAAGEDKETITAKQDALNRLFDLKARQEEENEQRIKDAAGSAAGASKEQEEIDRKNADLYLMLKSLEEKEEDERGEDPDPGTEKDTADTDGNRVGDPYQEAASILGASAAKRELEVKNMIDGMFKSGYGKLAEADGMMRDAQTELDLAAEALGRTDLSDAEREQLVSEHMERAHSMTTSNYGEMMDLRRKGHQEIRDAREVEQKHIDVSPLDGVDSAKQAIMDAGAAAALNEVSQGALDKASGELEERVQEAIDERNDAGSRTDEEEVQEKAEEIAAEKAEEKEENEEENEINYLNI